jgi:hypothetical protein
MIPIDSGGWVLNRPGPPLSKSITMTALTLLTADGESSTRGKEKGENCFPNLSILFLD